MGRRNFLLGLAATAGVVKAYGEFSHLVSASAADSTPVKLHGVIKGRFSTEEKQTPYNDVTHYNNFYEFGTGKGDPAKNAKNFQTSRWTVSIEGEVKKPRKISMDEILKQVPLAERLYRHTCGEEWTIEVHRLLTQLSSESLWMRQTPHSNCNTRE